MAGMSLIRYPLLWLLRLSAAVFLIVVTVYLARGFAARGMLPLKAEHRVRLAAEFRAEQELDTDWSRYLEIEDRLAEEARGAVGGRMADYDILDRHGVGSQSNPDGYTVNWNRSFKLGVESPRGTAVLIHGLSDSPYSMRATAELLQSEGYVAFAPRMPGHGFAVGDLRHARWEDWLAAVRIAMRAADRELDRAQPLILVGYSNGGLLAIRYALDCDGETDMPCPDAILLLSPAIEVTPFARLARLHQAVSWSEHFAQFQWESVLPEVDPYKFTSFPKNPGREIFRAARAVSADLAAGAGRLPEILTFQSAVDDTVSTDAVIDLYRQLDANGSELVVYDVNRSNTAVNLMIDAPVDLFQAVEAELPLSFGVTIVTNRSATSSEVGAFHYDGVNNFPLRIDLDLAWPANIFSLSHIAVPFEPGDPIYGVVLSPTSLNLGGVAPKGERKVLSLTSNYFARLRYNPFYPYQRARIVRWLERLSQSAATDPR